MAVPTVWSGAPESWSPVPAPGALRERDGSGPGAPRSRRGSRTGAALPDGSATGASGSGPGALRERPFRPKLLGLISMGQRRREEVAVAAPDTAARLQMISMARPPPSMYTVCFRSSRLIRYRCACRSTRKRMSTTFCSRSRSRRPACREARAAWPRRWPRVDSIWGSPLLILPRRCQATMRRAAQAGHLAADRQYINGPRDSRCRSLCGAWRTTPSAQQSAKSVGRNPRPRGARLGAGGSGSQMRPSEPVDRTPFPTTTLHPPPPPPPLRTRSARSCSWKALGCAAALRRRARVGSDLPAPATAARNRSHGAVEEASRARCGPCSSSRRERLRSAPRSGSGRAARSQGVLRRARCTAELGAGGRRREPRRTGSRRHGWRRDGRRHAAQASAGRADHASCPIRHRRPVRRRMARAPRAVAPRSPPPPSPHHRAALAIPGHVALGRWRAVCTTAQMYAASCCAPPINGGRSGAPPHRRQWAWETCR